MLLDGFNHVATLTHDLDRLERFYTEVFEAEVQPGPDDPRGPVEPASAEPTAAEPTAAGPPGGIRMSIIHVGPHSELNVFEIEGNTEADRQTPIFGRGRIDHLAVQAVSLEAFETLRDRLIARGAADEFVTDFGPILSVFFRDPDGLECELCVTNPDAVSGVYNPPGTPAARYQSA